MSQWVQRIRRALAALRRDIAGGVALTFAISAPVALAGIALAMDYSNLSRQKSSLQSVADAAALATAREMRLGNLNATALSSLATNYANAQLATSTTTSPATVTATIVGNNVGIRVTVRQTFSSLLGSTLSVVPTAIQASAQANVVGGSPMCIITLEPASGGLEMSNSSKITAPLCSTYTDSKSSDSINMSNSSLLYSAFTCSAGGFTGTTANFLPKTPQVDCPQISDPIGARPAPPVGSCLFTNLSITGGSQSLYPGTYCGGIKVAGNATVTLMSGTYVIKDGPLKVTGNSTFSGANVGFYMTGNNALIDFEGNASISLTAQKTTSMAGLLFFEDRTVPLYQDHLISTNKAKTMLGTIYLSRGKLEVSSSSLVADQSAWTIIVARRIELSQSPNLVMNVGYSLSDIPVPEGVGPNSGNIVLTQ